MTRVIRSLKSAIAFYRKVTRLAMQLNVLIFLLKKKRAYFRKTRLTFIFLNYLDRLSDTYE